MTTHTARGTTVTGGLLERDTELAVFEDALRDAQAGRGAMLALLGEPGIGKTTLLDALVAGAEETGAAVLTARGTQVERAFPFGLARQLFERVLLHARGDELEQLLAGPARLAEPLLYGGPEPRFEGDELAAAHALYWLAENHARGSACTVVAVDDLHWGDGPSLRFLAHLANRLDGVPLLLAVAARDGELTPGHPAAEVLDVAGPRALRPPRLTAAATGALLERELRSPPDAPFTAACHATTAGNPYLVKELAAELAANGTAPSAKNALRVESLGPGSVARRVCARLAQLGGEHIAFGRALSVLGASAAMRDVAALAGLDERSAATVADDLVRAGLARHSTPLDFEHPLVRRSIYRDIPPLQRSALHARAAQLLAARGSRPSAVAAQLLEAEPAGDAWAVEQLWAEARRARARGAPSVAIRALRRALAEPPAPDDRSSLLLELGMAEEEAGDTAGVDRLRQALDTAAGRAPRAAAAVELATALALAGDVRAAIQVAGRALDDLDDQRGEPAVRLLALLPMLALMTGRPSPPELVRLAAVRPDLGSLPQPLVRGLLGALALERAAGGGTAEEATALAEQALAGGRLVAEQGPDSPLPYFAAAALIGADHADRAEQALGTALEEARQRASTRGVALASAVRAFARTRTGDLPGAEEDAIAFRELLPERGDARWRVPAMFAVPSLAVVHLERAEPDAAERELQPLLGVASDPGTPLLQPLHDARGRLHMERGRPDLALEDFLCGRPADPSAVPSVLRAGAAIACAALGDTAQARALAARALEGSQRFGSPRSIGIALRAVAAVDEGQRREALLEEAVAALRGSCDRLELARTLVDLGAERRRRGERVRARAPLREGMALARRCGGTLLAERAYDELRAGGARPRKIVRTGVEELTPSERRVAAMAAKGMTNRQIAQALFVTVKTVEVHLSRCYQKLDIASRAELPAELRRGTRD